MELLNEPHDPSLILRWLRETNEVAGTNEALSSCKARYDATLKEAASIRAQGHVLLKRQGMSRDFTLSRFSLTPFLRQPLLLLSLFCLPPLF